MDKEEQEAQRRIESRENGANKKKKAGSKGLVMRRTMVIVTKEFVG